VIHLKLELIGDNINAQLRGFESMLRVSKADADTQRAMRSPKRQPWIARIVGTCVRFGLKREFLHGEKDHLESNSVGSRGVYVHHDLVCGLYEVFELESWSRDRRYFLLVSGDSSREITKDEAVAWAEKRATTENGG
jgi:hypothetical protein